MASTTTTGAETRARALKAGAGLFGAIFLLVGIFGFVPGITTNVSQMPLAGHDSDAQLLGIFQVNVLHNLVHLLFGAIGLWAARTASLSKAFLIGGGLAYLVLFAYGVAIDLESGWNFVAINTADNWLHLGLAGGMIVVGAVLAAMPAGEQRGTRTASTPRRSGPEAQPSR